MSVVLRQVEHCHEHDILDEDSMFSFGHRLAVIASVLVWFPIPCLFILFYLPSPRVTGIEKICHYPSRLATLAQCSGDEYSHYET